MADRFSWVAIKRGDGLQPGAVLAGKTSSDGDLYIGKHESGEIGKLNTDKGFMYNIWCHDGGGSDKGSILVVTPGCVGHWVQCKKGDPLPADACVAGHTKADGDLCACRINAASDVGKVNIDSGKVHNFWYKGAWTASDNGEIFCVGPAPAGGGGGAAKTGGGGYHPDAAALTPAPAPSGGGATDINSGASVYLRAHTGKHMDVEKEDVQARWDDHGFYQKLKIESHAGGAIKSGDTVFLTAHTGKVVEMENDVVKCRYNDKGNWQKFVIEKDGGGGVIQKGDKVFLKAHTGKYVDAEKTEGHVKARYTDKDNWQRFTIEGEFEEVQGGGGGGGVQACPVPHTLELARLQVPKIAFVVTPSNPKDVSLVAVHYNINGEGDCKYNFETTEVHHGIYRLDRYNDYPACKSGDKVSYWLCLKEKGLMVSYPDGAHPGGAHSKDRYHWTAP